MTVDGEKYLNSARGNVQTALQSSEPSKLLTFVAIPKKFLLNRTVSPSFEIPTVIVSMHSLHKVDIYVPKLTGSRVCSYVRPRTDTFHLQN
jgi:hypothetical protein